MAVCREPPYRAVANGGRCLLHAALWQLRKVNSLEVKLCKTRNFARVYHLD